MELRAFSELFKIQINTVDVQTCRIDRFGEDQGYTSAVYVLYDGIHYDALVSKPFPQASGAFLTRAFPPADKAIEQQAISLASKLKAERAYTDVTNFSIRCLECQACFKGQSGAQDHAKNTGHVNFGEV